MAKKNPEPLPLFEKVLAGGCVAAFGAYIVSESAFTMTILSVIVLAIVALFQEILR